MTDNAHAPSTTAAAPAMGPISDRQKQLVRDSFYSLEPAADLVIELLYRRLFELAPEVESMFSGDMPEQQRKFMSALRLVVASLDRLDEIVPTLQLLGVKHRGYGAQPGHYGVLGEALLWTFARCLKERFTPEVQDAWSAVYSLMVDAMAGAE